MTKFNLYDLFSEALEKSPSERDDFLRKLRIEDPELVQKLEDLLKASRNDLIEEVKSSSLRKTLLQTEPFHKIKEKMIIDHFVVKKKISASAATAVFLGLDLNLSRNVLLKFHTNESKEPLLVAKINHESIVQIYFSKKIPELDCYLTALEWIDGCNLHELLQSSNLKTMALKEREDLIFRWSLTLFEALKEIHNHNILHLDIKPQNILIDTKLNCKITDFNVSISNADPSQTVLGGTKKYMSPEQEAAFKNSSTAKVSVESDVFSLGAVLLEVQEVLEVQNDILKNIFTRCISKNNLERPSVKEALTLIHNTKENFEFRDFVTSSQKDFFFYRWASNAPILTTILCATIPNMVSTVFQILYNQTFIVDHMSDTQKETFQNILIPWNIFIYSIGFLILISYFNPVFKRKYQHKHFWPRLLGAHKFFLNLTASLWMSTCFAFLIGFYYAGDPLLGSQSTHFITSFLITFMIQGMFVSISLAYITHVIFAPRALNEMKSIRELITSEFANTRLFFQKARFGVGTVCTLSVILISCLGQSRGIWDNQITFQALIIGFCLAALAGFYFGVSLSDRFFTVMSAPRK